MDVPRSHPTCAFCKIIKGEIPSFRLEETELSYAFLALPPLTDGHALVIPKGKRLWSLLRARIMDTSDHAVKMHELPDEYLADALAVAKRIAVKQQLENYNILQNNGRVAYQTVDHVHFHIINKPDEESGLMVTWPPQKSPEELEEYRAQLFKGKDAVGKTSCL